jgi:fibronectin-binding autotransporter adhesin
MNNFTSKSVRIAKCCFVKIMRNCFLLLFSFCTANKAISQVTYVWRNDQNPAANEGWNRTVPSIMWWRGYAEVPTGNEILSFDGNSTNMTSLNNLANTSRFRIIFENTATPASRVINGSTTNNFFDFGGNPPAIVNNSGVTHTINFPFNHANNAGAQRMEINANNGTLNIGSNIGTNGGTRNLVAMGGSAINFTGIISNASGTLNFIKEGTGNTTLSAANTFTGSTTIAGGTVTLGVANALPNTDIALNGGTLSTGTGLNETLGVLSLGANSIISLGAAVHTLNFAASNAATWSGTLTINNWTPFTGKIFFGNNNSGLTSTQLSNINFTNFGTGAKILSTGEIVPNLYFISVSTGNFNTAATWQSNAVPGAGAWVYIDAAHTVTLDANVTIQQLIIRPTATFTASDASPRTLTFSRVASGNSINNTGTWTNGTGGSTVVFTSTAANLTHTVLGTIGFQHVSMLRTAGTPNIGITFSSASTINGDFTINAGGFVDITPPIYGTSSNLIYNTGATYNIFQEWTAGVTAGAGYPNNVVVGSSVASSGLNINTGLVYHLRGNLIIAGTTTNTSLTMATAQLNIGGNWINNSSAITSFTKGTGTVIFTGAGSNTIGGTNATLNGYDFYNLTGSKTGVGSIVFNSFTRVSNILNVTSGVLSVNAVSLSVVALNGTAGATLNNNATTNATITITDGAGNNCAAAIQNGSTGTLSIIKNGTGNQILSGANTYSGTTIANAGTLTIGSTTSGNGLSANSNYTFAGSAIVFANMPASSVLQGGAINMQANTNITLTGPNAYTINFAASDAVSWDLSRTITIFGWTPSANRIINMGTSTGLTSAQLARVNLDLYGVGAKLVGIELRPAFLYVTQASGTGDYNTAGSWLLGDRPVLNDGTESIFIQGTFTLNFTVASPTLDVLRAEIASGATLNMAAGERINIFPTGDFRVNGTINMAGNSFIDLRATTNFQLGGTINMQSASVIDFAAGISLIATSATANFSNQGTLNFAGAFSITANTPNAIQLPNVNLRASVDFGNNSTIRAGAALNMLPGGFVSVNAPVYAPGSRLVYNTGGGYNRGTEWSATSGKGYPDSVLIVNTALNLNAGVVGVRKMGGSLTIQAAGSINMSGGSAPDSLSVTGNVSIFGGLTLGSVIGADLRLGGNYYVYAGSSISNNNRAVWFTNGNQDQFIQRIGDGNPVYFDFLVIDKPGYTLRLTTNTNAHIISPVNNDLSLRILQLRNGDFDMNDGVFTVEGNNENSMNVFVDNGVRRIFTSTGTGEFRIRGTNATGIAKFGVIPDVAGTDKLLFDNNVEVSTTVGCNFGAAGTTTINAILRIDQFGYVVVNSPDYGNASTLVYNNGVGGYKRNFEWNTDNPGTTGAGYPHNVVVQNNTLVELNSTDFPANFALGCSGDFTIQSGSSVTTAAMAFPLTVGNHFNLNGSLTLSTNAAGLFNVGGNWARSSTGVFVQNNRNVNFNGSGNGILTANNGQTFSFMTLNKSNVNASLTISDNVAITDSLGLRAGKLVLNNKGISIISTPTKTASVGVSQMQSSDITYTGTLGKFFVERYMPARRSWRLMAAPFATTGSATISEAWQEGQARDYSTVAAAATSTAADTAAAFGTQITGGAIANGFDLGFTNNPSIRFFNAGAWSSPANTNATTVNSREGWMLFVSSKHQPSLHCGLGVSFF